MNISFALTVRQFRERSKTVTRRLGWKNLKPGTILTAVEKGQGLKKGEHPVVLGKIIVKSNSPERLDSLERAHTASQATDNLYAIGKDIEAQRARERWGCTNIEQAFRGYLAIPEKCGGESWWVLLKVESTASEAQIKDAFRSLAKTAHTDKGGDRVAWGRLQEAYDQAMALFRKAA